MAKLSLRRYDVQARFSVYISIAAAVTMLAMAALIFQHFDFADRSIVFGPRRKLAVLGSAAITMLLASIGFGMGWNSAGQRRNDKPKLSWLGFFIAAGVLCATLLLLFFFQMRGEPKIT